MTMKYFLQLILFFLCSSPFFSFTLTYSYTNSAGEQWESLWDIEEQRDHLLLKSKEQYGLRIFKSDFYGNILDFTMVDTNQNIIRSGSLEGSDIVIKKTINGIEKTKVFKKGDILWFQSLGLSFFGFVLSNDEKIDFIFINPQNMTPVKMTVKKTEITTLTIKEEPIKVQKVELRMTGILSPFWVGHYWLSLDSGIILLYKGTAGPGTPEVTMELREISGNIKNVKGFHRNEP